MFTIEINTDELLDAFISNVEQWVLRCGKKWNVFEVNLQTHDCRIVYSKEIEKGDHILDIDPGDLIEWNGGFTPFEYKFYEKDKSWDCLDITLIVTLKNPAEKEFAISQWKKTARKYLRSTVWDYRDRSYIGITYV